MKNFLNIFRSYSLDFWTARKLGSSLSSWHSIITSRIYGTSEACHNVIRFCIFSLTININESVCDKKGDSRSATTFCDHDNECAQLVALIIYQFTNYLFTLMYTGNHYIECALTSWGRQKYLMEAKGARRLTVQCDLLQFCQIFGDNAMERWCNIVEDGADELWWDDTARRWTS